MIYEISPDSTYQGIVSIPSSKSDSQRAILAAGLAKGTSVLRNIGFCNDERAMLAIIQKLGANVSVVNDTHYIKGSASIPNNCEVNVRESGLAARLLSGVFACSKGTQTIVGEGSVLNRKMKFYFSHKDTFNYQPESNGNFTLPLTFKDTIQTNNITVNGGESSQDISGLVYGLCTYKKAIDFKVLHLISRPYLQMTLNTLNQFGLNVSHVDFENFSIPDNNGLQACDYTIEGDWSSASFWLIASALGKDIGIDGVQLNSLQSDKQVLSILRAANCSEVRSQFLTIDGESRTPITVDLTHCPDLFPILTTYAALTPGVSKLNGVHRLHNKESDRAAALIQEFTKLGVEIYTENDTLIVHGKKTINGGIVSSYNDHRIAMSLAIAGLFATSPLLIEESECVSKSYPQFWNHLEQLKV